MRDRVLENVSFPSLLNIELFRAPLVVAPHPDDEVFGCGGLLALMSKRGVIPRVVILTDGEAQQGSIHNDEAWEGIRRTEGRAAAQLLGYTIEFWGLPDREVRANEFLQARLADTIASMGADLVLCPALHEPHPDHQATALALLWCMGRLKKPVDLCFYESGATLVHCTHLVDISPVRDLKDQALRLYASQESVQPYRSRIMARDHFRAMTLGPDVRAAEGFQWIPISMHGWSAVLPGLDPLFLHARHQAVMPCELPLISVLVRTMEDPRLEHAIASVLAQSHPNIELLIVVASGTNKQPAELYRDLPVPIRLISSERSLSRSQAANIALDAANGDYCLFLDDDDFLAPNHLEKLLSALKMNPESQAAHSDVQVLDREGDELMCYEQPFILSRLTFTNTLPIHSVLFSRKLATQYGCRFDESLDVLEDWDFWLQVCEHTSFVHVPGVSAVYRYSDRSALQSDGETATHYSLSHQRVCIKWLKSWHPKRLSSAIAWHASQLDRLERLLALEASENRAKANEIANLNRRVSQLDFKLATERGFNAKNAAVLSTIRHSVAAVLQLKMWNRRWPIKISLVPKRLGLLAGIIQTAFSGKSR